MTTEQVTATADELRELIQNEPADFYRDRKSKRDHYKIVQLRHELARGFAERNGWIWSPRSFTLECLQRGGWSGGRTHTVEYHDLLDHAVFFRNAEGRAVAVCSHLYDRPRTEALGELCTRFGLEWSEVLDFPSVYFPGRTLFYLFARRKV